MTTGEPVLRVATAGDEAAVDALMKESAAILFPLVRTAFGQRRKMLRRSLAATVAPEVFDAAHIDSSRRPEELTVEEWGRLALAWSAAR